MINFIKRMFFGKEDETVSRTAVDDIRSRMNMTLADTVTPDIILPEYFDDAKSTVIILDDNSGATMLFDEDIAYIKSTNPGKVKNLNCVKVSTSQAVFSLEEAVINNKLGNIVGAVLDITIGGFAIRNGKSIVYDGIDAYRIIKDRFPNAVIRFYTGHSMNEKNAEIYKFMVKYKELTGNDIEDVTYTKNPFTTNRMDMLVDILEQI